MERGSLKRQMVKQCSLWTDHKDGLQRGHTGVAAITPMSSAADAQRRRMGCDVGVITWKGRRSEKTRGRTTIASGELTTGTDVVRMSLMDETRKPFSEHWARI